MNISNAAIAQAYYTAMSAKDIEQLSKYLHDDVQLISPFGRSIGKTAVIDAVKKFTSYFEHLAIYTSFDSKNQAIVVYDVSFPEPIGSVRSVSLMAFDDKGLIKNMELIFDARSFGRP